MIRPLLAVVFALLTACSTSTDTAEPNRPSMSGEEVDCEDGTGAVFGVQAGYPLVAVCSTNCTPGDWALSAERLTVFCGRGERAIVSWR